MHPQIAGRADEQSGDVVGRAACKGKLHAVGFEARTTEGVLGRMIVSTEISEEGVSVGGWSKRARLGEKVSFISAKR